MIPHEPSETATDSGNLKVTAEQIREAIRRGKDAVDGLFQPPAYWDEWGPCDNPGT